jgi:hypothetical protein
LLDTAALLGSTFASLALAPLGGLLIVGTERDGSAKNTPQGEITNNPNDDKYSSLLPSLVPPFIGNQGDLDAYISSLALRQPTKKAFRGSQALCITTELSTSSSTSPTRISIYTSKRSALLSPAKDGISISRNIENAPQSSLEVPLEQVTKDCESTYCAKKMVFDGSLDEQEILQETKEESCRLLMAILDRFINKETQADPAQENARASRVKIQREQFEHTAHQNCNVPGVNNTDGGLETTSTHNEDGTKNDDRMDNNDFYSGENDNDGGNFTYHSSDMSDEDDENGDESWAMARMACHQQCLHVAKMVRVSLGDSWMTCQIGCMKLKQITYSMHHFFLLPPSPRFFRASHARISTTPQNGFPFFCGKQVIPHGRCLMKTSAK